MRRFTRLTDGFSKKIENHAAAIALHFQFYNLFQFYNFARPLDWIWFDLTRPENRDVWPALSGSHPARSRVELFDMAWWMHFRSIQPIARPI